MISTSKSGLIFKQSFSSSLYESFAISLPQNIVITSDSSVITLSSRLFKARSRKASGAGLGLALCAEIAKKHDAVIRLNSEINKGTIITVTIKAGCAEYLSDKDRLYTVAERMDCCIKVEYRQSTHHPKTH